MVSLRAVGGPVAAILLTAHGLAAGFETAKPAAPVFRCEGFVAPLHSRGPEPMKIARGRTLPLKATLLGPDGAPVTPARVAPPPRVKVRFAAPSGKEVDRTSRVASGDFGKQGRFVFRESYWKFDLQTDALPDSGTYVVELASGDESQYRIEPTCGLRFALP